MISITIPSSVVSIGNGAFDLCSSLTSISIPGSVVNLGTFVLSVCTSLTNASLPIGLTNVPAGMFSSCSNLSRITIPRTVNNIGNFAFETCSSLTGVYFEGNTPTFGPFAFYLSSGVTIYYLPDTAGWTHIFGVPIAPWMPEIQLANSLVGVRTNGFGFTINWASGMVVAVDATTNLSLPVWSPLETNVLNDGSSYFVDLEWTNYPNRFYRVRSQ